MTHVQGAKLAKTYASRRPTTGAIADFKVANMRHVTCLLCAIGWMIGSATLVQGGDKVLIIGHRGASGYRPDHTLASYQLAIDQGADFVEADLVITKDGVLVCRHECDLGETTDVAQRFPQRKRKTEIDGEAVEGWFAHDFTLAEIKTLRARQPLAFRDKSFDGKFAVPTFEEQLQLVKSASSKRKQPIGIIPEIKHSTYHSKLGLPIEDRLLALLAKYGYTTRESPCVIQSFEVANLQALSQQTQVRLLQLIGGPKDIPGDVLARGGTTTYADLVSADGLAEIAKYAWAVGPSKANALPVGADGRLTAVAPWLADAKRAGLKLIVHTFRNEPRYLAKDFGGDPLKEYARWFEIGVDAVFTDFPDTAHQARERFRQGTQIDTDKNR
jgi:glycerophosphoryl diester phosphodiesterase